ncbi:Retrovirus-related Pol polyprotein from transposon TNT 1-94-like protein [Drosera capensis]
MIELYKPFLIIVRLAHSKAPTMPLDLEELYMEQPEEFVLFGNEKKVCKLIKSLYSLKQAPKQWHEKFDTTILAYGFCHNSEDRCIYFKFTKEYDVIVCLDIDDMLIIGTVLEVNETKKYLSSVFKMKDLGEARLLVLLQITQLHVLL